MDSGALEPAASNPWSTIRPGSAYEDQRLVLRKDEVVQPDGARGEYIFLSLRSPVVGIVPLDADGNVTLVRQWRYPWDRSSWEIPAGHCEPGESVETAARRELAEESRLAADSWTSLGLVHASAVVASDFHLFLATDLHPVVGPPREGAEQDMVVQRIPLDRALEAAATGQIVHAVSVTALFRTGWHLRRTRESRP